MDRDDAQPSTRVLLGVGSNMGDREAHLVQAVADLGALVEVEAVSSVYESAPVGPADQPDYLNLVVRARTTLGPIRLLDHLLAQEHGAGRVRTRKNGPRPLDLDLLFYGDRVIRTERLVVPHARWRTRAFVVVPLLEVAPELVDPRTNRPVRELVEGLDDLRASLRRVGSIPALTTASGGGQ